MRRALVACLVLVMTSPAVFAEERALLYPQSLTPAPYARSAAVPESLMALREAAAKAGTVRVIVGTRVPFGAEGSLPAGEAAEQRAEIAAAADGIRERFAEAIRRAPESYRSYESIPFVALEVTAEELERLAADPDVINIVENRTVGLQLRESAPMVQAGQAHLAGFTGAGQTVAVLDTGIDKNHPFLGGRVVEEACFSLSGMCPGGSTVSTQPGAGMPCPLARCEHGTHVAGIAAGAASTATGVASAANIISIQVASNVEGRPLIAFSDIAAGLEHVYGLRSRFSIAAVNLSLGGGSFSESCDSAYPPVTAAIRNLRSAGIATVAASGNEGLTDSISFPACISDAVSVGSVSDVSWGPCSGQPAARDKVACYSNSANILELLAPGSLILSSGPGNSYFESHGTSMAAPHVAGAWAVLKQKTPGASVAEVQRALESTGTTVTDYRNGVVKPRINVKAALDQLTATVQALAYTRAGSGRGSVTFSPPGSLTSCDASCINGYEEDLEVTLTAAPQDGSVFNGWSGDCSGTGSCTLRMNAARSVTATFTSPSASTRTLSFARQGSGQGSVTFSPAGGHQSCRHDCVSVFPPNMMVMLQPKAEPGSVFKGWSGSCRGLQACRFRMNADKAVTANFEAIPAHVLTYVAEGDGTGTVTFIGKGSRETCTGSCSRSYTARSKLTLAAKAAPGSRFTGWGGACRGMRNCTLTLAAASTVTAGFEALPRHTLTYSMEGQGTVSFIRPAGETSCTANCTWTFAEGTRVTLRATAAPGYRFAGWRDACRGRRSCSLLIDQARSVTAVFTPTRSAATAP